MTTPRDPHDPPAWNDGGRADDGGLHQTPRPWDEPSIQDQPVPPPPAFPPAGAWSGGANPYGEPPAYGAPAYGAPPTDGQPSGSQPYAAQPYGPTSGSRHLAPATAGAATSFAFSRFGRGAGALIAVLLVTIVLNAVVQLGLSVSLRAAGMGTGSGVGGPDLAGLDLVWPASLLFNVVDGFVSGLTTLILAVGSLRLVRTGRVGFSEFFELPRGWVGLALVSSGLSVLGTLAPFRAWLLLGSIVSLVGLVAIIYSAFHLVDAPGRPWDAVLASGRTVLARLGTTLLMLVIALGLVIVGALACGVGLLVAVPVVTIAFAALHTGFRGEVVPA